MRSCPLLLLMENFWDLIFVKIDEMAVILAFNDRIGCIGDLSFALFHLYLASNNEVVCKSQLLC